MAEVLVVRTVCDLVVDPSAVVVLELRFDTPRVRPVLRVRLLHLQIATDGIEDGVSSGEGRSQRRAELLDLPRERRACRAA